MTGKTRINKGPNKWLILMWHHFCYYKRHWFYFFATITLPFFFLGSASFIAVQVFAVQREVKKSGCLQQTTPSLSAGFFHVVGMFDCRQLKLYNSAKCPIRIRPNSTCPPSRCVPRYMFSEQSLASVRASNGTACDSWPRLDEYTYRTPEICNCETAHHPMPEICDFFQGDIMFFPRTTAARELMAEVNRMLTALYTLTDENKLNVNKPFGMPINENIVRMRAFMTKCDNVVGMAWTRCLGKCRDDTEIIETVRRDDRAEGVYYEQLGRKPRVRKSKAYQRGMNTPPSSYHDRFGDGCCFPNLDYALAYMRRQSSDGRTKKIWGVVDLTRLDHSSNRLDYTILGVEHEELSGDTNPLDHEIKRRPNAGTLWLQELVETAFIRIILNMTNTTKLEHSILWKQMPEKCSTDRLQSDQQERAGIFLQFTLAPMCVMAFLLCPITFLTQVLAEKELKLREYLSIMGVGDLQLKISWIVFFMAALVPLCIFASVHICFLAGGFFSHTECSIFFVQLILLSIAQMAFSYFLSSILHERRRVAFLLGFVNIFLSLLAVCVFKFSDDRLKGRLPTALRVISLHCSTPFALSMAYTIRWQTPSDGAKWSYFFETLHDDDAYGGFGEGMLWLIGDTLLYLFLAWYFQHVTPGEYGIRYKPWFLFQPSFWMPERFGPKGVIKQEQQPLNCDVEQSEHGETKLEAVVILDKLTKYYNSTCGVDRVSLTFFRGEITSLLGQNGAGKSTTMNTLVGLLTPTSGKIYVCNVDTHMNEEKVKECIGFVPQYNILYPSLTVDEHLQFFGWLKGMDKAEIRAFADPLLAQLGLGHMRNQITTALSGGQKRKLSIMTAYLGEPDVVILDEPTSGVDAFSRRGVWDLILLHCKSVATVLSTHFMDEADILSDRVAIISEGTVRAVGTPRYIKSKYGKGFRVTVACTNAAIAVKTTRDFFEQQVPGCTLAKAAGQDLTFSIPKDFARSEAMIDFLKSVEYSRGQLGVSSFGVSEPTLEEAFFSVTDVDSIQNASQTKAATMSKIRSLFQGIKRRLFPAKKQPVSVPAQPRDAPAIASSKMVYKTMTGCKLFVAQFGQLLLKRLLSTLRNPLSLLSQIILPFAFASIILFIGEPSVLVRGRQMVHIYKRHQPANIFFFQDNTNGDYSKNPLFTTLVNNGFGPRCPNGMKNYPCTKGQYPKNLTARRLGVGCTNVSACLDNCEEAFCFKGNSHCATKFVTPSSDIVYALSPNESVLDWILAANQSDHIIAGGFQIFDTFANFNSSKLDFPVTYPTYWHMSRSGNGQYNREQRLGDMKLSHMLNTSTTNKYVVIYSTAAKMSAMTNAFNNLLLQTLTKDPTATITLHEEHELLRDENSPLVMVDLFIQRKAPRYVSLAVVILAFTFATFGIAVAVQYEKGSNLKALQFVTGAEPAAYWLANMVWDYVLFLLILSMIMLMLGVKTNSISDLLGPLAVIALPYGFSAISFVYIISLRFKSVAGVNIIIFIVGVMSIILALALGLAEALYFSKTGTDMQKIIDRFKPVLKACMVLNYFFRCIPYYSMAESIWFLLANDAFQTVSDILASATGVTNIYALDGLGKRLIQAYLEAVLYFFLLVFVDYWSNGRFRCCKKRIPVVNPEHSLRPINPDVLDEEQRVLTDWVSDDPVLVRQVCKKYPRVKEPAVDYVTFSIPRGQCFGLLGVNGAGKTSLFNILAGFQPPTSGVALIENFNVATQKYMLPRCISYCPQEYTLFGSLDCKEHLRLYGTLRGVPRKELKSLIEALVEEVGLTQHMDKRARELSGGNQRKLQLAIALLDYKPVIFLDEPTSGMDPGARRKAWTCINNAVARGCSVVLTSHSMDECEALSHRIVILVKGRIRCIGSVQYLKDDLGNRYTAHVKLTKEGGGEIHVVKEYLSNALPDARLTEEHTTMLKYEIDASHGFRLSALFSVLLACRNQFSNLVEDFALSQMTLENIFVNMAAQQEDSVRSTSKRVTMSGNKSGTGKVGENVKDNPENHTSATGTHPITIKVHEANNDQVMQKIANGVQSSPNDKAILQVPEQGVGNGSKSSEDSKFGS